MNQYFHQKLLQWFNLYIMNTFQKCSNNYIKLFQLSRDAAKIIRKNYFHHNLFVETIFVYFFMYLTLWIAPCIAFFAVTLEICKVLIQKLLHQRITDNIPGDFSVPVIGESIFFLSDSESFFLSRFLKHGRVFQSQLHILLKSFSIFPRRVVCVADVPSVHIPRSSLHMIAYKGYYGSTSALSQHLHLLSKRILNDVTYIKAWEDTAAPLIHQFLQQLVYESSFSFSNRIEHLCCEIVSTIFLGIQGFSLPLFQALTSYLQESEYSDQFITTSSPAMAAKSTILQFIHSAIVIAEHDFLRHEVSSSLSPSASCSSTTMIMSLLDATYTILQSSRSSLNNGTTTISSSTAGSMRQSEEYDQYQIELIFLFLVEYVYRTLCYEMKVLGLYLIPYQQSSPFRSMLTTEDSDVNEKEVILVVESWISRLQYQYVIMQQNERTISNGNTANHLTWYPLLSSGAAIIGEASSTTASAHAETNETGICSTEPNLLNQAMASVKDWSTSITSQVSSILRAQLIPSQHEGSEDTTETEEEMKGEEVESITSSNSEDYADAIPMLEGEGEESKVEGQEEEGGKTSMTLEWVRPLPAVSPVSSPRSPPPSREDSTAMMEEEVEALAALPQPIVTGRSIQQTYQQTMLHFVSFVKDHTRLTADSGGPTKTLQYSLYECTKVGYIQQSNLPAASTANATNRAAVLLTTPSSRIKTFYELHNEDLLLLVHQLPSSTSTPAASSLFPTTSYLPTITTITTDVTTETTKKSKKKKEKIVHVGGLGKFSDLLLSMLTHALLHNYRWSYLANPRLDGQQKETVKDDKSDEKDGNRGFCSVPNHALQVHAFHPEEDTTRSTSWQQLYMKSTATKHPSPHATSSSSRPYPTFVSTSAEEF